MNAQRRARIMACKNRIVTERICIKQLHDDEKTGPSANRRAWESLDMALDGLDEAITELEEAIYE